nr:histidine-rich glycoprotein-like [Penaeus vannamei]
MWRDNPRTPTAPHYRCRFHQRRRRRYPPTTPAPTNRYHRHRYHFLCYQPHRHYTHCLVHSRYHSHPYHPHCYTTRRYHRYPRCLIQNRYTHTAAPTSRYHATATIFTLTTLPQLPRHRYHPSPHYRYHPPLIRPLHRYHSHRTILYPHYRYHRH